MCKPLAMGLSGLLTLFFSAAPAASAENPVGVAVRRLHLTPQQLLSLRDYLGPFNHSVEVEASDGGLFVLRSQGSMSYAGEFTFRLEPNGVLQVDRISGPATLDLSRGVVVPLRLLAKPHAQVMADLASSQYLNPAATPIATPEGTDTIVPPAPRAELPAPQIAGLKLIAGGAAATVTQSRALFAPDGSGVVASVRAATAQAASPARLTLRYYSAVRSDGTHAWRDSVTEFNADVLLGVSELETRFGCSATGCAPAHGLPASTSFHMIRWQHALIASVPAALLSQLAPPGVAPAAPAPLAMPDSVAPQATPAPPPETSPGNAPQL